MTELELLSAPRGEPKIGEHSRRLTRRDLTASLGEG